MKLGVRLCFLTVSPIEIEGLCSINVDGLDSQLEVTCKVGDDEFKKHFLGISDNMTQLEPNKVDPYHYRVVFKPEVIIDMETSG